MTRNRDGKKPPASHNYVKLLELHTSKIALSALPVYRQIPAVVYLYGRSQPVNEHPLKSRH